MVVTTVAMRLAVRKIAEIACGMTPEAIPVVALGDPMHRVFAVSIPSECRAKLYPYLMQHLAFSVANDDAALFLTSDQASALIELTFKHVARQAAA
jgi:hypothetical protein